MSDFREAAESIPVAAIADEIRALPPEGVAAFRCALELATRDTSKPLGRGVVATMAIAAIRLAGSQAASEVSVWDRIAANRPGVAP